jgi:hypothetical protein
VLVVARCARRVPRELGFLLGEKAQQRLARGFVRLYGETLAEMLDVQVGYAPGR